MPTGLHLLYKLPDYPLYHLFPTYSVTQEVNSAFFNRQNSGFSVTKIYQEDGSTFTFLNGWKIRRKDRGAISSNLIIQGLRNLSNRDIRDQSKWVSREFIHQVIEESKSDDFLYIIVVSHIFIDRIRIFPFLIDYKRQTFYDLSMFLEGVERREKDFGVFISNLGDIDKLQIVGVNTPVVIDYPSSKKLCMSCGMVLETRVSNIEKVRHRRIMSAKACLLETQLNGLSRVITQPELK